MGNNYKFSLGNFERWLKDELSANNNDFKVGEYVLPKISFKKIIERIELDEGDIIEVAKCFRKNGGIIESIQNDIVTIKTKKGKFSIDERDIIKD